MSTSTRTSSVPTGVAVPPVKMISVFNAVPLGWHKLPVSPTFRVRRGDMHATSVKLTPGGLIVHYELITGHRKLPFTENYTIVIRKAKNNYES